MGHGKRVKKQGGTINEVAREAGVSISTVSRIINGTAFVAEDKRRAVEAAMHRLDFQPNYLARTLITGRSMTVGVIAEDIVSPFYADVIRGVEHALLDTPYQPVLNSGHWSTRHETRAIDTLIYRKVDALLLLGSTLTDDTLRGVAGRVPLILFGRRVPGLESHCLTLDQRGAALNATRHLIELGHRRIVHLHGPPGQQDAQERREGYRDALTGSGLPLHPELELQGDFLEQSAAQALTHLLDARVPFTAVFAGNDQMAAGARLALYRRGLRVPDDVSLIGFDDLPASAFTIPPLTTVRQPTYQIGQALARHALNVLAGQPSTLPDFDLPLIMRESTRPLR